MAAVPIDETVIEAIKQARRAGRKIHLATAADRRFAEAIAAAIGEFDGVLASENGINLSGKVKADRLVALFRVHGFDYIGNSVAGLPVWRVAHTALISSASSRLSQRLSSELLNTTVLSTRNFEIAPHFLALRPHEWLKNVLVALPALAAHDFSINSLITVVAAMISFSLGVSSIYLVNDMLDLTHDCSHPQKRYRSLAAGRVPLSHAVVLLGLVLPLSVALALTLPLLGAISRLHNFRAARPRQRRR